MNKTKNDVSVLISGISGSIGSSLCSLMISRGYKVIGVSRKIPADQLVAKMPEVKWLVYDSSLCDLEISLEKDLTKLIGSSDLHSVFHCAGKHSSVPPMEASCREYLASIEANLISTVNIVRLTINLVKPGGSILVLNSQAALSAGSDEIAYGTAKRAVSAYIDSMQHEATKRGLQLVNVICGAVQSTMVNRRSDLKKFIDPAELSEILYSISVSGNSLRLKNVEILRRNY